MMEQLERMDTAYPSNGLVGYIENAKRLLEDSKQGVNPLEGWSPSIPDGKCFELGSEEYTMVEEKGMGEMGKCGFVLVAGGLGERLGYSGIKLGLPTELSTETTYLQFYIETILAIQSRYASPNTKLPLCIMVSNDTIKGTIQLLKDNHNFGMDQSQITLVQQGDGVPALSNNDASFVLQSNNPYALEAKPHGHGDIHALLHSHNVVQSWEEQGLEWVIFFQDTNGLAFHTLPLALGVSKMNDFIMNSMAVPRKAKQAVGGIAKLKKVTGEERTINVEYNQLDPLLRASGYPDGDVNDPNTGFSPYPGNINQLLFQLKPYCQVLKRSKGAMPEFVNPKYADAEKTTFKKPTRLECMMQDFPTTLVDDEVKRVGFTSIGADLCFSPVKNATSDGVNLQKNGTHPGVAASGEADQYAAVRKIMKSIGCVVEEAESKSFSGIAVIPGPDVVLKPDFVLCPAEYKSKFPNPSQVKISSRSSLVIKSSGVVIESLNLDGALVVECEEGASGVVRDLAIKNQGWSKVVDESSDAPEYIRIRGYRIEKNETTHIIFKKDGTVEGLPAPSDVTVDRTLESLDVTTPVSKEESNKSQECACVIQ
jgi:UDP-sugar pyrophosphorylase